MISRLTYKSRVGGKGFAEQFSIYISPVPTGDNFQKITEGSYTVTNDMLEVQFETTKAKRVKFVFDKARENWASISDIRLYKEDAVANKMKKLFLFLICTALYINLLSGCDTAGKLKYEKCIFSREEYYENWVVNNYEGVLVENLLNQTAKALQLSLQTN